MRLSERGRRLRADGNFGECCAERIAETDYGRASLRSGILSGWCGSMVLDVVVGLSCGA
jgi:hypothetical protein